MALAGIALALVYWFWYPAPLDLAVGVTSVFLLLLGVDVVLGPLLTLIVYKAGKKSLRFDLAMIVCVQLLAFVYGMGVVIEGRPAWLVFNANRFDLVRAHEIDTRALERARPAYRAAPYFGPRWVAARRPESADERSELVFEELFAGLDFAFRPQYYLPLEDEKAQLKRSARSLDDLKQFNSSAEVAAVRERWPEADGWLPLKASRAMVVLLGIQRSEVIAVVDLRPWL